MEADLNQANAAAAPVPGAVFFDGASSRRRVVALKLSDALEIREDGERLARWAFADIRRADSPSGLLRLSCLTAPALARLEVRDAGLIEVFFMKRPACLWGERIAVDAHGHVAVPQGPGLGYEPDRDVMEKYRVA